MNRSWCRPIWQGNWTGQAPVGPEAGFTLPLLSLLHGVATVLWICALVSLFSSGAVFGVAPPATVPVWVVALFLCMAYGILVWPLKVARRGFYWGFGRASWSSHVHRVPAGCDGLDRAGDRPAMPGHPLFPRIARGSPASPLHRASSRTRHQVLVERAVRRLPLFHAQGNFNR